MLKPLRGEQISLINPAGQSTPFGTVPREIGYNVSAIFEIGLMPSPTVFAAQLSTAFTA